MTVQIKPETCIKCKDKLWCGLSKCPVYSRSRSLRKIKFKKNIEAPTQPFYLVSWKNYPQVAIGPNLSINKEDKHKNKIEKMMEIPMNEFLVNMSSHIRPYSVKHIRNSEEASLSINPILMNAKLKSLINLNDFDLGQIPTATAKSITLEDTPKIPGKVFEIVDSHDLKAELAVNSLEKGFGFDYAVQALSTGNLGIKSERKFVPTRWAITAVDSIIAKTLFEKVRNFSEVEHFEIYEITHWDNHFVILFVPWGWAFEMMESWHRGSIWGGGIAQDYEYGRLKKNYASNITGAYYSARMEVLKHLESRKKRAAVFVFRNIGPKYVFPVGVWHVRNCVNEALKTKPEKVDNLQTALLRIGEKMNNIKTWKKNSQLLPLIERQQRLLDYY